MDTSPPKSKKPKADTAAAELAEKVNKKIYRYMGYAAGVGLFPIPAVDVIGLTALQLKLVREIHREHAGDGEDKWKDNKVKAILTSLLGAVAPAAIASGLSKGLRGIPVVGPIIAFTTMPIFAAGTTYATGKVFHAHLAGGGDLTNFNVKDHLENYKEFFKEGKSNAKAVWKNLSFKGE